jgi:hypothetical protein
MLCHGVYCSYLLVAYTSGLGSRVSGLESQVSGVRYRVSGLRFRVGTDRVSGFASQVMGLNALNNDHVPSFKDAIMAALETDVQMITASPLLPNRIVYNRIK